MSQIVVIEDKSVIPGSHNYLHEGIENSTYVNFIYQRSDTYRLDIDIHRFLSESIIPLNPEIIILACSLGEYHSEYLGIRVGLHLRLTKSFGVIRNIPIIFYSPDKLQDILRFNKMATIVGTPQCYLTRDLVTEIKALLNLKPDRLNRAEYELFLNAIYMDPPENYLSVHSVTNEWGSYKLDQIAGTNVLEYKNFDGMFSLFFKWLEAKSDMVSDAKNSSMSSEDVVNIHIPPSVLKDIKPVTLDSNTETILKKNLERESKKRFK